MENNNFTELEELRSQMAVLKDKLSREEIVSERLLRQTMKGHVRFINSQAWVSGAACVAVILMMPGLSQEFGLSIWLVIFTAVMMLFSMGATIFYHRGVSPDMMNGNLLQVAKRMRKLKNDYKNWKYIGYPMAAIWSVWFSAEIVLTSAVNRTMAMSLLSGLLVGGIAGVIIGLKMQKKTLTTIDEIISQIED